MRVVRNVFVDIHYTEAEREQAERLAQSYESRGYSREADDEKVIQLLRTTSKEEVNYE